MATKSAALKSTEREKDAARKRAERQAGRDLDVGRIYVSALRKKLLNDDAAWLKTFLPHVFYHPFTESRLRLIEEIGNSLRYGSRKCVAAPRGDGKSTITKYLALKYALEKQVEFVLILAATGNKANQMLGDIKRQLRSSRSQLLRKHYKLECEVARYVGSAPSKANNVTANGRAVRVEWKQDLIVLPNFDDGPLGGIMMAIGVTSDAVQGANYNDIRPSFVILDDLDSRDSLAAQDGKIAEKIETIIDHTVAGLGGPGKRLGQVMLCTIPSRNSVAFRFSDPNEKPAWSGVRIPRIIKWPTARPLWDEYVHLRQQGKGTLIAGRPSDALGRQAHELYLANREAMDAGAVLSNEYDFEADILPDGSQKHASALQKCWDYIADNGMDSFQTEHQNDPPAAEADANRLMLTSHHIQHGCLSGLERRVLPDGVSLLTIGADVQKRGLHWAAIAWSESAAGCIVDYDFWPFLEAEGREAADCEMVILEGLWKWHESLEQHPYWTAQGEIHPIDLALIDMGWKDESWASQPVQVFCNALGNRRFMASKGQSPYRPTKPSPTTVVGEHWHCTWPDPFIAMNSDHWKLKVHEGFLQKAGAPGSLLLFDHPRVNGNLDRNKHAGYAQHILAESWETRIRPGFKRPETKWWHYGKPNHWLDATYQAMVARSVRGLRAIDSAKTPVPAAAKASAKQAPPRQAPAAARRNEVSRRRINFRR